MKLLAFDPGETTGWAFLEEGHILGGSFPKWEMVDSLIDSLLPQVVIVESFMLYGHMAKVLIGSTFPTVEVIGVIKYIAEKHGIPVQMQQASQTMHINLKDDLGETPWDDHARSALKHGIRYAIKWGDKYRYDNYRHRS